MKTTIIIKLMSLGASNPIVNTKISSVHFTLSQVCATSYWILRQCEMDTFRHYKKFLELKKKQNYSDNGFVFA